MDQSLVAQNRPCLTLRIGVTGHRPNRLDAIAQTRIDEAARAVLERLSKATSAVQEAHADVLAPGPPELRLVTALAEGADTILARAASDAGMRLDVILPFRRADYVAAQGLQDAARATFQGFLEVAHSVLELDRDPREAENEGYLASGRCMLEHSDLLVAIWDGETAAGVGGTAEIVNEALGVGIPVIWIRPDGGTCVITENAQLSSFAFTESDRTCGTAFAEVLNDVVRDRLAPPDPGSNARARLERFMATPTPVCSRWFIYDFLRYLVLRRKFHFVVNYGLDKETDAAWARFRDRAELIGGTSFAQKLADRLEGRWRHADALALHFSHAYRSTYVANFGLAAFAVVIGLVSVFWWNAANSIQIKGGFVFVEVALIGAILLLTRYGGQDHCDWHGRWLESRAVAELLRPARLTVLIGSTVSPPSAVGHHDAPDAWVEWYVRATLREIGPPSGLLDAKSLRTAISSAIEDEIDRQIAYNKGALRSSHRLDHWLHVWGERLFLATFLFGIAYLFTAILASSGIIYLTDGWKQAVKALTTLVGGGFPACGAALFGIRATGDFLVAGEQAKHTLAELELLKKRLNKQIADPSFEQVSPLLANLTRTLSSDTRDWSKIYRLRELTLPG